MERNEQPCNATVVNLTLNATTSKLIISSGQTITVTGTFSNSGTTTRGVNGPGTIIFTGTATFGRLSATGTRPNVQIGNGSSANTITIDTTTPLITDLTIMANATLSNTTNNRVVTIGGNISNSGTWNAGTGVHTLDGAAMAISGTVAIPSTDITGTYTNNGTFTAATALSGAGGLTNSATGVLNLNGTSTITTLTATAISNTVNYTGAAQTVHNNAYHHLGLSGSLAKTMTGIGTVAGNMTMSGSSTATTAAAFTISGSLNISDTAALTTGAYTFSVGTTTTVGATASIIFSSATNPGKTFTGDVTVRHHYKIIWTFLNYPV